ncbi:MAG: hypothetical protein R6U22_09570 [Desulfohalobiaceae bacterium]
MPAHAEQGLGQQSQASKPAGKLQQEVNAKVGLDQVKVFDAADSFFDLSSRKRLHGYLGLNTEERQAVAETVGELAKRGHIGYEILDIQDRPYKSFISTKMADSRTANAQLYDQHGYYRQNIF